MIDLDTLTGYATLDVALAEKPGAFAVVKHNGWFYPVANAATERALKDASTDAKTVWAR